MREQDVKRGTEDAQAFFPVGAVAFFTAMVAFYAALWLVLFAVMAGRP